MEEKMSSLVEKEKEKVKVGGKVKWSDQSEAMTLVSSTYS